MVFAGALASVTVIVGRVEVRLVSVVQFALLKFEIFCKTKFVEGIVQEKARLLFAVARHNDGLGTV